MLNSIPCISLITFILYTQTIWCTHPSWTIESPPSELSLKTEAQLQRHYCIQRIIEYIQIIQQFHIHNPRMLITMLNTIDISKYKSSQIKELHKNIVHKKKINPLYAFWQSYSTFHDIADPSLNSAFFEYIKEIGTHLLPHIVTPHQKESLQATEKALSTVTSIDIAFRFYFIERITHIFSHIDMTKQISTPSKESSRTNQNALMFKHPIIQKCAYALFQFHDIAPFFTLYKQVTHYAHIDDLLLYKEFLILTFFALHFTHKESRKSIPFECNEHKLLAQFSIIELLDLTYILIDDPIKAISTLYTHTKYHEIPITPDSIDDLIFEEFDLQPKQFILYTFRRFYTIGRLKHLFNQSVDMLPNNNSLHTTIRPLSYIWKDMCRYMYLADQLIVDTYAQQLFLLSYTDYNSDVGAHRSSQVPLVPQFIQQSYEALDDIAPFIAIEPILTRFCAIKRIAPLINQLRTHYVDTIIDTSVTTKKFSNPAVIRCIQKIMQSKNLAPFFALSELFSRYHHLQDPLFEKEYYTIAYLIHTHIYRQLDLSTHPKEIAIEQLLQMEREPLLDALEQMAHSIHHTRTQQADTATLFSYMRPTALIQFLKKLYGSAKK